MELGRRWWQLEGDEAAQEVVAICHGLEDGDARKARWQGAHKLYSGQNDLETREVAADLYNVSRSAVDTAQAEIASRQRPKPMFLTSGADWKTKRKAKKLDRFVEAWLHQPQGRYADAWELMEDCFRAASIAVGGVCKVSVDVEGERIVLEHVPAHEILVDPEEAEGGDPQNWFHAYSMDLDLAIECFATTDDEEQNDHLRAILESSADMTARNTEKAFRVSQKVRIFEGWRLPLSADKPGKHVFACEGGCLHEEDWTWPYPPLVIQVWNRDLHALWGTGLVEEGEEQHETINDIAERLHDRFTLCAHRRTYYEPGTVGVEDLASNDSETMIPVADISKMPRTDATPPVSPAEVNFLEQEIQRYYDFRGISQMSAQAKREPGVEAAIAMQTLNDIKSVRFMPKARAYELAFVRLGELIVRAARDLADSGAKPMAKWPGQRFIDSIPWSDVDMAEDMFEVRVAPVSSMSRDPAQRLQIAEQLMAAGMIPKAKYFELIGAPDLDSLLMNETSQERWIESLIDRYLDAEDDDDLDERGGYDSPDGFFIKPLATLVTVQQMYYEAKLDGAPAYNLGLLQRYMRDLKGMIEKLQAPPAPPPGAAAGPLAGAPPGPPGPPAAGPAPAPPPPGAMPPAPPVAA